MSKIIAPNSQFSGLRAGIHFINGQGETDNEYLIGWFLENGYQVIDSEANEEANESEDELDSLSKEQLQDIAKELNLDFNSKTNKADLIEMIKVAKDMEE